MTGQQKERLVAFVYLLTRGTPEFAGVPWGAVKGILRAHLASGKASDFTSPGGEALAREIVDELLGSAEKPCDPVWGLDAYFDENGYPNTEESSVSLHVRAMFRFECGAVVTCYKSGKAIVQGKCTPVERDAIATLLRAADWIVK